ncbi:MAG: rhamnulokinase [Candidatus Omnitrophica bacterium]|nr:rhamnulokinase [Candidatus Omnitrophota bacterium]
METKRYIAIDLGAESGRGLVGEFNGEKIVLKEIHRFPTHNVRLHSHIYWDVLAILSEIKKIISITKSEGNISGVGITTWGVDYGLIGENDLLLSNPFHYRDKRTDGLMEEVFGIIPKEKIFERTGIQFMPLNTLYQLYATKKEFPYLLNSAKTLLFMPDLFNFFLTGRKVSEYTIASTSQMYDSSIKREKEIPGEWAIDILEILGIPAHFLPEVVLPGTLLGNLSGYIKEEIGVSDIPVYTVCCHDTASAVVSVPAKDNLWAYLSSGTWSLLGVEIDQPVINEKSLRYNFTNEGGYGKTIRFLKNIMGLWILQECRRQWQREGKDFSYQELTEMASSAKPFFAFIDVNHKEFLFPGDMPGRIQEYCKDTNQNVPEDIPQISRVILESLAMEYRCVVDNLEDVIGTRIETLHIVGGGSQNKLLSQFAASATKKIVIAGPVEATGTGNILVQAIANREISDISQLREVVRRSFPLFVYQPKDTGQWDENYERYKKFQADN